MDSVYILKIEPTGLAHGLFVYLLLFYFFGRPAQQFVGS